MEGYAVIVVLLTAAVFYVIGRVRRGLQDHAISGEVLDPASPETGGTGSQALYAIAEALGWPYQQSARPADLRENPDFRRGVALLASDGFSAEDLAAYFGGENAIVASIAAEALKERADGASVRDRILPHVGTVATWPLYFALQYLSTVTPGHNSLIGPVLARTTAYLGDRGSCLFLEEFIRERLDKGETPEFADELERASDEDVRALGRFLASLDPKLGEPLQRELWRSTSRRIDWDLLASLGTVWDQNRIAETDAVVPHEALLAGVAEAESLLLAQRPRSVLLVGETGVGKETLVAMLARRLYEQGWTILESGHAELIAGQTYIGQLEDRVKRLIEQLRGNRRVLWIVPAFHNLAFSGLHRYSPVSVLDTVLPYIENGEITVVGLTQPAAYERLTQRLPGVANALAVRRVSSMPAAAARKLAVAWLSRLSDKTESHAKIVDEAWELAQQFLSHQAAPGNIFRLLKLSLQRRLAAGEESPAELGVGDLMTTLSALTGLPVGLLDDRRQLDIEGLRQSFNERVLGQPEAVECLVERVAMIKAGVTDPTRPAGVFLFAGPTGTGKTELAKALAEWLFGSEKRMIRLDMSEFQTPNDLPRLLGESEQHDGVSLVNEIRERPFSVVLLDEFEKAHPRVWDLFLQVFDDGRMTDRMGQTADFRHAIIILTSNLGGAISTGVSLGFRSVETGFDPTGVVQAVEQAFRKEFINRLDRVVVFRPLSRELMRQILDKELGAVLKRRGLRSRPWAVEWDEAARDLLLEKGFTPDLGARPLKRAIDRYLLSPLAMTIVRHQVPAGDQFLFVTRNGEELDVQFVDPDEPTTVPGRTDGMLEAARGEKAPETFALTRVALEPQGTPAEIAFLRAEYDRLEGLVRGDDWKRSKVEALGLMQEPAFWDSPERFGTLDMIERRDRVESGLRRAGSLLRRLAGSSGSHRETYPQDLMGLLSQNLYLLDVACADIEDGSPSDAVIRVSNSRNAGGLASEADDFAAALAAMYRAWARRRRMRLRVLGERGNGSARGGGFLATVEGFGAYTILAQERGLHILERPAAGKKGFERVRAVVEVAPQASAQAQANGHDPRLAAQRALEAVEAPKLKIVRRYRREPSPLVRDSVRGWRSGRLDQVLNGDFDLFAGRSS